MNSIYDWLQSLDWRAVAAYASGIMVVINAIFLLCTIGVEEREDRPRYPRRVRRIIESMPELETMRHMYRAVADLNTEVEKIRYAREEDRKSSLSREKRLDRSVADLQAAGERMEKELVHGMYKDLADLKARMEVIVGSGGGGEFEDSLKESLVRRFRPELEKAKDKVEREFLGKSMEAQALIVELRESISKSELNSSQVEEFVSRTRSINDKMKKASAYVRELKDISSRIDACQMKLASVEKFTEMYETSRQKIDAMCGFYDLMDGDGFWTEDARTAAEDDGQKA